MQRSTHGLQKESRSGPGPFLDFLRPGGGRGSLYLVPEGEQSREVTGLRSAARGDSLWARKGGPGGEELLWEGRARWHVHVASTSDGTGTGTGAGNRYGYSAGSGGPRTGRD